MVEYWLYLNHKLWWLFKFQILTRGVPRAIGDPDNCAQIWGARAPRPFQSGPDQPHPAFHSQGRLVSTLAIRLLFGLICYLSIRSVYVNRQMRRRLPLFNLGMDRIAVLPDILPFWKSDTGLSVGAGYGISGYFRHMMNYTKILKSLRMRKKCYYQYPVCRIFVFFLISGIRLDTG